MVVGISAVCLLCAVFSLSHPRPADEVEAGRPFRCGRSLLPLWSRFFRRRLSCRNHPTTQSGLLLPPARVEIDAQFLRVFDGQGTLSDVHDLATKRL